jgi:hypothetical protein
VKLELHFVRFQVSLKPVGTKPLQFWVDILEIRTKPDLF